jgi:transglutaminase-like putative cysteine protease
MKFSVSSSLYYHINEPATLICSTSCHGTEGQEIIDESLTTSREVTRTNLTVGLEANRLVKLEVPTAGHLSVDYQATVNTTLQLVDAARIKPKISCAFEAVTLPYLNPSRYAPADRMRAIANDLFGGIRSPLAQVLAVEDWLFGNISYQIGTSNEQSWSLDTFESRVGVCRDFAHLGIAFCRALNIPARYVMVYAYYLIPQDFHAVFEVYLDGGWYVIDGTRKAPLNGMIRIATGHDAGETAVACLFGDVRGQGIYVSTQLAVDEEELFVPITRESLRGKGQMLVLG